MTKNIEVDVTDSKAAIIDAARLGVRCWVVLEDGPGGGNPLVALEGPTAAVDAVLAYWGYNEHGEV